MHGLYTKGTKERIIRTLKGILLSLLLHLLILFLFVLTFKEIVYPPQKGKEQKITLNLSKFVPPPAPKTVQVTPPTPQLVKKEPLKEIINPKPIAKKKLLDEKKRLFVEKKESEENNVTEVVPKKKIVKKKVKKKIKKVRKKRVAKRTKPKRIKKQKRSKDPLANALMGSGSSLFSTSREASSGSYGSKIIKELYGKEFATFTPRQKKFIKDNLGTIHHITQRTLTRNGYPNVAIRTKQQGTNIVSFYLHPNGNITGLRLKRHIGYAALDQNTLEIIRIAYKDYPRPKTKTKITFYVKYSIY